MFTRQALALSWKSVRPYFVFSIILFFAALVVGGTPNGATDYILDQIRSIQELAQQAQSSDHPQNAMFWIIFRRNLTATITTMYMGIAAGIYPLFTMALNGMVLGFMFGTFADKGENVAALIVKGILPHGILELPALFLASGFGLLLGVSMLRGLFGSLFGKTSPWEPFVRALKGTVPALMLLVVLLFLAALVESTVTYSLMS